jgi:predicted NBD/HSP70 family sugar kinase
LVPLFATIDFFCQFDFINTIVYQPVAEPGPDMTLAADMIATIRTSGTNLTKAKSHNFNVILEVIRTRGPVSRTTIADITSLSRQTVQNIVFELEEAGLVRLTPGEIRGRGHPGMEVSLNPEGAFSLGFHADRHRLTAVACDMEGVVVWSDTRSLANDNVQTANMAIVETVFRFREAMPVASKRLLGVGVAAPGPFGLPMTQEIDFASFQELGADENVAALARQVGLPVVLENDATAAAIGEWLYGVGRGTSNLAVLHFGVGLGAGFVLGGTPYRGRHSNAGEIGHMVVVPNGKPCFCGNQGCLERYLSLGSVFEHLNLRPNDPASIEKVAHLCITQDQAIASWLDEASGRLRQAINFIEVLLDPDTIAIGGLVPDSLLDRLISGTFPLLTSISSAATRLPRVQRGASGPLTVARGAAAVAIDTRFAPSPSGLVL